VHLLQSRIEEAILWFEKARSAHPGLAPQHALLASAYALKSEHERAAEELAEARRLNSNRYSSIARLTASGYSGTPNYWGAKDPHLVRNHLFRRSAQGRGAGGMTAYAQHMPVIAFRSHPRS
jgi:tetratricopeptide (TPR) repeat protein